MKYEDPITGVKLTIPDEDDSWPRLKAWAGGFLQVMLVSLTTVAIVKHNYVANFAGSLALNAFWLYNVRTATKGTKAEKWAYAFGAATGSVTGAFLGHTLLS